MWICITQNIVNSRWHPSLITRGGPLQHHVQHSNEMVVALGIFVPSSKTQNSSLLTNNQKGKSNAGGEKNEQNNKEKNGLLEVR